MNFLSTVLVKGDMFTDLDVKGEVKRVFFKMTLLEESVLITICGLLARCLDPVLS